MLKINYKKYKLIFLTFFAMLFLCAPNLSLNNNVFASFTATNKIDSNQLEHTPLICDTITLEPITDKNRSDIQPQLVNILLKYDDQTAKLLDFNITGKFTVDTANTLLSSTDPASSFCHSYYIALNQNSKQIVGNVSATFYQNNENSHDNMWLISLGIFIDPNFFNKGIATQALLKVAQHYISLPNVKNLYYVCFKNNTNSQKLVNKVFSKLAQNNQNLTFSSKYVTYKDLGTDAFEAILQKS